MSDTPPFSAQQQALAGQQSQLGSTEQNLGIKLQQPLVTGTLPVGAQALVNQILNQNLAGTRTKFSGLGLGNSTMEQSAENLDRQGSLAQTFGVEEDMAKIGQGTIAEALQGYGGASSTYNNLATAQMGYDEVLMKSIADFAGSIASAGKKSA